MSTSISCHYEDALFTPQEVEAMTGVSPLLQRTWQRRGFLGRRKYGRANCTAHELAQIMALHIAAHTFKVDLKFVHEAVSHAGAAILWFALGSIKAWDIEGASREEEAAFKRAIEKEDMIGLQYLDKMVGLKKEYFGRYLVRLTDECLYRDELDDLFLDERVLGGIVINLAAVGRALAECPKRPRALIIARDIELGGSRSDRFETPKKTGKQGR